MTQGWTPRLRGPLAKPESLCPAVRGVAGDGSRTRVVSLDGRCLGFVPSAEAAQGGECETTRRMAAEPMPLAVGDVASRGERRCEPGAGLERPPGAAGNENDRGWRSSRDLGAGSQRSPGAVGTENDRMDRTTEGAVAAAWAPDLPQHEKPHERVRCGPVSELQPASVGRSARYAVTSAGPGPGVRCAQQSSRRPTSADSWSVVRTCRGTTAGHSGGRKLDGPATADRDHAIAAALSRPATGDVVDAEQSRATRVRRCTSKAGRVRGLWARSGHGARA